MISAFVASLGYGIFNHILLQITCKMGNPINPNTTASDIHKLLDELYFVPVWRSEDEVIQPVVGKPFSPKSPPVCPMVRIYNSLFSEQ